MGNGPGWDGSVKTGKKIVFKSGDRICSFFQVGYRATAAVPVTFQCGDNLCLSGLPSSPALSKFKFFCFGAHQSDPNQWPSAAIQARGQEASE